MLPLLVPHIRAGEYIVRINSIELEELASFPIQTKISQNSELFSVTRHHITSSYTTSGLYIQILRPCERHR